MFDLQVVKNYRITMAKYTNIHGEVYTFTKQGIDKVLMEGNFEFLRVGGEPDDIVYINPSGGPFIKKGQMLSHIILDTDFNVIVEGFANTKKGILINTKPHDYDPEDMSHLADTKIIGGIINTSYK